MTLIRVVEFGGWRIALATKERESMKVEVVKNKTTSDAIAEALDLIIYNCGTSSGTSSGSSSGSSSGTSSGGSSGTSSGTSSGGSSGTSSGTSSGVSSGIQALRLS